MEHLNKANTIRYTKTFINLTNYSYSLTVISVILNTVAYICIRLFIFWCEIGAFVTYVIKRYLLTYLLSLKQSFMRHLHYPTGWTNTVGPTSKRLYGQTWFKRLERQLNGRFFDSIFDVTVWPTVGPTVGRTPMWKSTCHSTPDYV